VNSTKKLNRRKSPYVGVGDGGKRRYLDSVGHSLRRAINGAEEAEEDETMSESGRELLSKTRSFK